MSFEVSTNFEPLIEAMGRMESAAKALSRRPLTCSPADVFGHPADQWAPARSLALGELARLAYKDERAWRSAAHAVGWDLAEMVDVGPTEVGVVYHRASGGLVLAPRGTNSVIDAASDVSSIVRVPWRPYIKGAVGYGWKRHAKRGMAGLEEIRDRYAGLDLREIWVVGHSLAGAIAPLMRAILEHHNLAVAGTITFNAPRVGGTKFCAWYDERWRSTSWRAVNVHRGVMDKVSRVPWLRAGFDDYGRLVIFQGARPPYEDDADLTAWTKMREKIPVGLAEGALTLWRTRAAKTAHSMNLMVRRLAALQELGEVIG